MRDDVRPRIHRSRGYVFARAWGTVVQRDLQVATVIGDVLCGRPVIYTTFLAYDEVAHHSGIERHDALAVLRDLDRQIARIARACAEAPRPYRLVVLSDHGQSQGETFRDRYGQTFEELVRAACGPDSVVAAEDGDDDALSYLSAGLTEVARDDTVAARTVRAATRGRRADGSIALDPGARREIEEAHGGELPELSVMASGCLGLISFPREPGRVSLERIEALYPRLIPTLREHPGIGFVLVRSEREGAMAIGAGGTHFLDDDRVEGEDPLAPFGPNAADHLRRTDSFPHCADLMLNSTYWPEFGEVAAFEELVGSHGGMGGTQSFPFVLHPAEPGVAGGGGRRSRAGPPGLPRLAGCARPGRLRERGRLSRRKHAGGDVRRQLPHEGGELLARKLQLVRAEAGEAEGVKRAPVDRYRQRGRQQRRGASCALRVEVTRAERRAPAPDRQQRQVELGGEGRHARRRGRCPRRSRRFAGRGSGSRSTVPRRCAGAAPPS